MTQAAVENLRGIRQSVWRRIREHLVDPVLESHAPIPQVGWGAAIGMFVGMTPTVGIQIYLVACVWAISRYVFRMEFNLPISMAMVWISNPITVLPLYYAFLRIGEVLLGLGVAPGEVMSFTEFKFLFKLIMERDPELSWLAGMWEGVDLLFWTFGWPIVIGSLVVAVPLAVLAYPVAAVALIRNRRATAEEEGLSYEEWTRQNVRPD